MPGYVVATTLTLASVALVLLMMTNPAAAQTESAAADFYGAQCAACHGAGGEGGGGPSLQTSVLSVEEITTVIAEGAAGMPGFADALDDESLEALTTYVAGFQDSAQAPTTTLPAATGGAVYSAECAGCHGASGGGGIATSLYSLPYTVDDVAAIVRNGVQGMPGFAGRLNAEQIELVAGFVVDLEPSAVPVTTQPPAPEPAAAFGANCAACHGANGEGGIGPALSETTLTRPEIVAIAQDGAIHGPVAELDAALISAAAEHIAGFGDAASPEPPDTAATSEGAELYVQACAACHGEDGSGGIAMSILDNRLDDASLIEIIAQGRGAMPGLATTLTPDQMEQVAAFVAELWGVAGAVDPPPETTTATNSDGDTAADAPLAEVDTGPSFWGPLLATLATFAGVTGLLSINRRRMRSMDEQEAAR
jgi:mono/diheme cytochrome c family protein